MRAKSAATAQFAKEAKDAKKHDEKVETEIKPNVQPEPQIELVIDAEIDEPKLSVTKEGVANVFKTIKTNVKKSERKSKKPEDHMTRKVEVDSHNSRNFDRRKYLEYKYAARELLENDSN